MKQISVHELRALTGADPEIDVLDVRTPAEYQGVHVASARSVPLDELEPQAYLSSRNGSAGKPVYLLCHSGARAKQAAHKFASAGFEDCVVVEGGTQAWVDAGYPVVRGATAVLPLDRQLQITIGAMVLTGVFLARFVNPAWIWFSAFVGCGLIFAGVTGICMMRSLLARMPWNQVKQCGNGSCACH